MLSSAEIVRTANNIVGAGSDVLDPHQIAAQETLRGYGVTKLSSEDRLIRLRSALYHRHSIWFNHSESDKDAILIAIAALIGEPKKALYPDGEKPGNESKPSDSLSALKRKAQKLLVGYGMDILLVEALDRLRIEVDNLESYCTKRRLPTQ